jgi:hypothetical protein
MHERDSTNNNNDPLWGGFQQQEQPASMGMDQRSYMFQGGNCNNKNNTNTRGTETTAVPDMSFEDGARPLSDKNRFKF